MSARQGKHHYLLSDAENVSAFNNLDARLDVLLSDKMHGISFSAYREGQKPGDELSREQIAQRMAIIAPYFNWVRSFSTTQGNERIPAVAKDMGLKTLVGAWLGTDADKNRQEVDNLIELAHQGAVDVAAVGNEVLYREDLSEGELLDFMAEVRKRLPAEIPMGYVDAYYEFEDRPNVTAACDVLLTNCYPFWEGCAHPYAILYMQDMYRRVQRVANGKRVIISETGWPSAGGNFTAPSLRLRALTSTFLRQWSGRPASRLKCSTFRRLTNPGKWRVKQAKEMSVPIGDCGIKVSDSNTQLTYECKSSAELQARYLLFWFS